MKEEYKDKTKEQLINELVGLRQRITELEVSENERKQAEEKLKASEEKYRSLAENTADILLRMDLRANITYMSKSAEKETGYSREEIEGKNIREVLTPESYKRSMERLKKWMGGTKSLSPYEVEVKAKDGRIIPLELNTSPIIEDGKLKAIQIVARNITERKRADEALRESGERFRAIFEGAEDAIFTKDRKGNYTHVNHACASLFKLPLEEMIGKTDFDLFSPEVAHHIKEEIDRKVLENGEVVSVEDTKPTAGVMRTFHVVKVPLRDANGAIVGLCGIARDITERKRMEEVLQASETEKKSILNAISDVVVFQDKSLSIQWVNEAAARSVGKTPQEVVGCHCYELWHGRSEPCEECPVLKALKTGSHANGIRKTPGGGWWEVVGEPVWDGGGNIVGAIEIARDITERKQVEEALRESEERFRTIVETAPSLLIITDAEGNNIYASPNCEEITGYTQEELRGERIWWVHEDDTPRAKELFERTFREGVGDKNFEYKIVKKNGEVRHASSSWEPLKDEEGKFKGIVFQTIDITECKQAEEERERLLNELEATSTELEWFTYTVSHDLKSPLIAIQGFAEVLRNDLEQNEIEKVKSDLKYIESSATKMDRLLTDMLELSRIGRMVNPPEDVSFGEIVQEALEQTTGQLKSSGVEITVAEDFPAVHVDRMRIVEVLVNLITNSINYMGEQPSPKIDIDYRVDGEETLFFVQDNGIGIDKSQHEKVFELFYTVDKSGKGTGAGLARTLP
jgi:PAS domain S-box-containing protein